MMGVEVRKRIGGAVWRDYFKFTIMRKPFDQILSRYHWTVEMHRRHGAEGAGASLNDLMRHRAEFVNENWLIYTAGDEVLVDDVERYERLDIDLGRISARIGLNHNIYVDLKHNNAKAGFRPDKQGRQGEIAPDDAAIIGALCRKEIESCHYAWPHIEA